MAEKTKCEIKCELDLEHFVMETRAQELHREARRQARQGAFLREERRRVREDTNSIEIDAVLQKHMNERDWYPEEYLAGSSGSRLRLNVGGQVFEVGQQFLKGDSDSLLVALGAEDCPLLSRDVASPLIAYVDRDWWMFRHVLTFLRDGILPRSRCLVLRLYKEAAFWRLQTLKGAIEETHLNLTRSGIIVSKNVDSKTHDDLVEIPKSTKFWLKRPNWWESQAGTGVNKTGCRIKAIPSWWKDDDTWKGVRFGPLSLHPEKVVASKSDVKSDSYVYPMLSSTWGYCS